MITIDQLNDKWNSMPMYQNAYLRVDDEHPLNINIGYAAINEKTMYIFDVGKFYDILPSASITATCIEIEEDKWAICLQLLKPDNADVFLHLCWDLIEYSRSESAEESIARVVARYAMWQRLLSRTRPKTMNESRQKGLYGELIFLSDLAASVGWRKAVCAWTGPEGTDQDFIYDDTWTEVKAILLSADHVFISSIEQLDANNPGRLMIYRIEKANQEDNRGVSLYDLVSEVRSHLINDAMLKNQFDLKLFLYGYDHIPEYKMSIYRLCSQQSYLVNERFPKLTRCNIPNQISNAKYSINIATVEDFMER